MGQIPEWKFQRWTAFLNMEPQGGARGDLQAGIIASTIANVNRRKYTPPYKAKDFMPKFGYEVYTLKKQQSVEELKEGLFRIHKRQEAILNRSKSKRGKKGKGRKKHKSPTKDREN